MKQNYWEKTSACRQTKGCDHGVIESKPLRIHKRHLAWVKSLKHKDKRKEASDNWLEQDTPNKVVYEKS